MIIDAHNHPDWHGHDLNRVLANMDRYHIDRSWLLAWECPRDEYNPDFFAPAIVDGGVGGPITLQRCISYDERAPGRFVLGYAPDPRRPEAMDQMQAAMDIYGIRVCGELKLRMMVDNPDALRLFRFCGEKNVPVIVHMDYPYPLDQKYPRPDYWYGGGIDALERALQACPETVFLGHAPGFWVHLSGDELWKTERYPKAPLVPGGRVPELMRSYPNLYGDLSAGSAVGALKRDAAFSRDFFIEFQDRLLYARDCFDNGHQEFINSLDLPAEVAEKVYAGNALKLVPDLDAG